MHRHSILAIYSVWSSEGIETVRSGDVIECVTNHFTSFALLVTFEKNNSTAVSIRIIYLNTWDNYKLFYLILHVD